MGGVTRRLLAVGVLAVGSVAGAADGAWASGAQQPTPTRVPSGGCSRPFDDARVRCLFDATGRPETFTVPSDVSYVSVDAWGGEGAPALGPDRTGVAGGRGRGVSAALDVRGGEELTIVVGVRGRAGTVNLRRSPRRGAGGETRVGDASRTWLVAGGGRAALGGTAGVEPGQADEPAGGGSAHRQSGTPVFRLAADPLGKVGDGRVRLVFARYDSDGPPSVVIRRTRSTGPSSAAHFTAVFSQAVTGFTAQDVRLSGNRARGVSARVRQVAPHDGTHFDIAVPGAGAGAGAINVSVPAGAAMDHDFTGNTASTSGGREGAATLRRGIHTSSGGAQ